MNLTRLLLIAFLWAPLVGCPEPGPKPLTLDHVVDFPGMNAKVYIRAREWGLTGDHEETRFQLSPIDNGQPCLQDCFVLSASEVYYSTPATDTLHLYAIESAVPKIRPSMLGPIRLDVSEVKSYEELRDYAATHNLRKIGF